MKGIRGQRSEVGGQKSGVRERVTSNQQPQNVEQGISNDEVFLRALIRYSMTREQKLGECLMGYEGLSRKRPIPDPRLLIPLMVIIYTSEGYKLRFFR